MFRPSFFILCALLLWGGAASVQAQTLSVNPLYPFGAQAGDPDQSKSALLAGTNGIFYGTSQAGGDNSQGTIFQVDASGTAATLYSFTGDTDGSVPAGGLAAGTDGALYGTTSQGGDNSTGTIFQLSTSGSLATIYTFSAFNDDGTTNADGAAPMGTLASGAGGNLYGTASAGGANGTGTIFQLASSGTLTTLYSFEVVDSSGSNAHGAAPAFGLTSGTGNLFYGVASTGGTTGNGTIFRVSSTGTLATLHTFSAVDDNGFNDDGAGPSGALAAGPGGVFYGTTSSGGTFGNGTVFQITASGSFTTLHSFTDDEGIQPDSVVAGTGGDLYGTTASDNQDADGTIFHLEQDGSLETYFFTGGSDGTTPNPISSGTGGTIYGTTAAAGDDNQGSFFQVILTGSSSGGGGGGGGGGGTGGGGGGGETGGGGGTGGGGTGGGGTGVGAPRTPAAPQLGTFVGLLPSQAGIITLNVATTGKFKGTLLIPGTKIPALSGTFSSTGAFAGRFVYNGKTVPLYLEVFITGGHYIISVHAGPFGTTAYKSAVAPPQTISPAKYTLLFSTADTSPAIPQGISYATLAVAKTGKVLLSGKLADGNAFKSSGVLVQGTGATDEYLFYDKSSSVLLTGAVDLSVPSSLAGTLRWSQPARKGNYYKAGFSTALNVTGSTYAPPLKTQTVSSTSGNVTLSGAGISIFTQPFTADSRGKITVAPPNTERMRLSFSPTQGTFAGSFINSVSNRTTAFGGAFVQNPNSPGGAGFFLGPVVTGTGLSGTVLIQPTP